MPVNAHIFLRFSSEYRRDRCLILIISSPEYASLYASCRVLAPHKNDAAQISLIFMSSFFTKRARTKLAFSFSFAAKGGTTFLGADNCANFAANLGLACLGAIAHTHKLSRDALLLCFQTLFFQQGFLCFSVEPSAGQRNPGKASRSSVPVYFGSGLIWGHVEDMCQPLATPSEGHTDIQLLAQVVIIFL